mmetsp:Transcript_16258/g.45290  ORF Transcript_16258/g.45290 Transcript_16258/m.45290 type:complete len:119 (-) Transcript_16258:605-961(-)
MATTIIRTEDGHQQPHGGSLVNLMVADDSEKQFLMAAYGGKIIECSDRNACDVELLCVGAFSPLTGFMDETTYMHCVEHMRLPSNDLFGIPVVLDTSREDIQPGDKVPDASCCQGPRW